MGNQTNGAKNSQQTWANLEGWTRRAKTKKKTSISTGSIRSDVHGPECQLGDRGDQTFRGYATNPSICTISNKNIASEIDSDSDRSIKLCQ
jgi:hypothetical protein